MNYCDIICSQIDDGGNPTAKSMMEWIPLLQSLENPQEFGG
jgi:hypothetical protein